MRIFLTGGTGFIGSNFLNYISDKDVEITAIKRFKKSKTKIHLKKEPFWIVSSLTKVDKKHLLDKDLLVHLAAHSAQPPYDDLQTCIKENVIKPLNLFEKAYQSGVRKFLVAGSCFEYGLTANNYDYIPANAPLLPLNTYPASKALASIAFIQWAIEKKVSLSIKRIFYVYGEGEQKNRFYPSIIYAAKKGIDFEMTRGEQIRDTSHINIIASLLYDETLRIVESKKYDVRISNMGSGNNISMKKFATDIWEKNKARGKLLLGNLSYRDNEIMNYVPNLDDINIIKKFY